MSHENKTLKLKFSRDGYTESHYIMGTGEDALTVLANDFSISEDRMGVESLEWVKGKLASIGDIDALHCLWNAANGDWTISTLCE